ncbi:MDR family NADP-dependent oxidoreductase [Streptomyces sp. NPDC049040]|uniref:MDR family NADP-dependent oxidoreductase n=1 Tax=Streptomyces sp. NPDC049040 TaxID=3365593 RepID=UPI003719DC46
MATAPSSTALPGTAREVRLTALPAGLPAREHFAVVETPLPAPAADQVLVRNTHFLVFAALCSLIGGPKGLPMPALHPGDTLFGPAVGEVLAAPAGSALRPGDTVAHMYGWRDHALVPAAGCTPLGSDLPDPVAHLSPGSAAYGALTRLADIRQGDTVFVTGAAGGVGSLAGQIARLLGAGRVVGSTGSPWKAEKLVSELGYDAVVVRGAGPVAAQLAEAAPGGIDVLLDNVAGEQLVAALGAARQGARFALVGTLSGQLSAHGSGGAPVEIDAFQVVLRGVSLRGYTGADHPDVPAEWTARFGEWLRSGAIRFPYTAVTGIDNAPQALQDLLAGSHFGAVVVQP